MAAEKFSKVAAAYEVLSDPEKRQVYDIDGEEGLEEMRAQKNRPASPFDHFFGGGQGKPKGPDAGVEIQVSLEELYNGAVKEASFHRNVICHKCRGTGAKGGKMKKCKKCNGQGVVMVQRQMAPGFNVQMQQHCEKCGGKGKTFKTKCPICSGHKVEIYKEVSFGLLIDDIGGVGEKGVESGY